MTGRAIRKLLHNHLFLEISPRKKEKAGRICAPQREIASKTIYLLSTLAAMEAVSGPTCCSARRPLVRGKGAAASAGSLGDSSADAALAIAGAATGSGCASASRWGAARIGATGVFSGISVFTPGRLLPAMKVSAADTKSQAKSMPESMTERSDDEEKIVVNIALSFCAQKQASF
ncbi:MAG TPA: hypothetical protein VFU69_08090 [Ktedonobacterales bacterium]|nr:hypothetical protein [Ktedonobacterales bacterium]